MEQDVEEAQRTITRLRQETARAQQRLARLRHDKNKKSTMIVEQFFPARIHALEQSKHRLQQELRGTRQQKQLLRVLRRGADLKSKQQWTPEEAAEFQQIQEYIKTKEQQLFRTLPRGQLNLSKMAMKTYRTDIHTKKFPNNYYQFLTKHMTNPHAGTALDIIGRFYTESHQGLALEAMWTILISMGFCGQFPRQEYDFYEAVLKEPTHATSSYFLNRIMTSADYLQFLKHTPYIHFTIYSGPSTINFIFSL
jgi:hypothetical protein